MKQNMVMQIYLISRKLYTKKVPYLPKILQLVNRIIFACDLPYTAYLGNNTRLGHNGLATVIHPKARIGNNTLVMQHTVIGGNMGKYRMENGKKITYPVIGNNVVIGAGAKILGPVIVEDYAHIGAGSIVLKDVLEREVVVGVPAKLVKKMSPEDAINSYKKI